MPKDIRNLLKDFKDEKIELSNDHQTKFKARLIEELHPKKTSFQWLYVAASIVLLLGLSITFYPTENIELIEPSKEISLGSISPEFKTIETYYTNSISLEISQLELSEDNKEIIDNYLVKLSQLTKEYKSLTKELNKGVNDATIDALISNLQLRLQLLKRLKKQLKQLKNLNTKQNETQII